MAFSLLLRIQPAHIPAEPWGYSARHASFIYWYLPLSPGKPFVSIVLVSTKFDAKQGMIHRSKTSRRSRQRGPHNGSQSGMTLIELILACSILIVLASLALPVARYSILAGKERELHRDLLDLREAVDRYKELADQNKIKVEPSTDGYPQDLETLAKEIPLGTGDKKIRFLRKIPADPMTGQTDWGLRCDTDEPDATAWCGKNVFDVYSKSQSTSLDGTKYSDW